MRSDLNHTLTLAQARLTQRVAIPSFSGQTYDYALLAEGAVAPSQAANLVVAELRRGQWRVLYVGQTDYLPRNEWREALERIRLERPRAQLLYRLNLSHGVREAEADDIARLHVPEAAEAA